MVRPLRTEPHARPTAQPEPAPLRLPPWHRSRPSRRQMRKARFLFTAPPACRSKAVIHRSAVAPMDGGQLDDVARRPGLVVGRPGPPALGRARLAEDPGHARRSETPSAAQTWATFSRRREGLVSFAARTCGSPRSLLEDHLVEREVRHRAAQTRVLLLEFLEPLHRVELQAPELVPPAVVGDLVRRGLGPVAAHASPPIERIASPSVAPCATITSTRPAASPRPPRACASSSAWILLRGRSQHYRWNPFKGGQASAGWAARAIRQKRRLGPGKHLLLRAPDRTV